MDSSGWVIAGASVAGVLVTIAGAFFHSAFSNFNQQLTSARATQKVLFDKLDVMTSALHDFELHVAETYVNEAKLERLFDPINRRLESIEKGLRDERARST